MKPLEIVCPTCGAVGWCMRALPNGTRIRAKRTHVSRIKLARKTETIEFHRVASDACGNPRYVVHFLNLLTREELNGDAWDENGRRVMDKYTMACARANTIGGRKYSAKSYGGGIVFQSYSVRETASDIGRVTGRTFHAE